MPLLIHKVSKQLLAHMIKVLMEVKKIKGRKRHIAVDTLGNLLSVVVHAANIHDTKAGIFVAKKAFETYPSLKGFCADAGYWNTFEREVSEQLGLTVRFQRKFKIFLGIFCPNVGL